MLKEQGQSIALVCLSGIQFYTGQLFDMEKITRAGQQQVNSFFILYFEIFVFSFRLIRDVWLVGI